MSARDVTHPLVTILVPTLREEHDIAGCIESIAAQEYPRGSMELVIADGRSEDATVAEVWRTAAQWDFADVTVVDNPERRTSVGLNAGLAAAEGEFLVRIDARARVPRDYVSRCVETLRTCPDVGVVGGAQIARARSTSLQDRGIARALRNQWSMGLARYRRGAASGPTDTVWMGSFRTADLRRLGGWADEVALNEDYDLNRRFRDAGHVVWFDSALASGYIPRADYAGLGRQYFYFGRVKGMWWVRGVNPAPRQMLLLALPALAAGALAAVGRRHPLAALLMAPAGLVAVDAAGGDGPAPPAERVASSVAIGVYATAWWLGVVIGAVGELTSVRHRHDATPG